AYSGASGIFVIAAGAVIFRELRRAGARPSLAMAATAMSGSTGVVLSPCLLVLIIAYLDRRVGSDELFAWGYWVYLLSSTLFVAAVVLTRRARLTIAPAREAAPATLRALRPLVPYALLFAVVPLTTWLAFDDGLNTISAPVLLPVILLAVIVFEGRRQKRPARVAVEAATAETSVHIGALLLLMALSACLGGVIERAEVMTALPAEFGSTWLTMAALVVVLVVVGMVMDPYGAVILVAATVAEVAYRNGIDPVHFWMVVLVAFELGYLTPPVALNHLLARQVVGVAALAEARAAEAKEHGFWARHERLLLPLAVMAAALLLVAFGPLVWQAL
ncbi:MAG: TRAP transporter large permease subunit, partial [Myxococcales bacterium]|nr:TRAP transporter large permease subunit [Myxococcales bacterium]